MLQQTSDDFSKFVFVNMDEKLKHFNKSIDDMHARLEEFQTMVFFAEQERIAATNPLNTIASCTANIEELFSQIDSLEILIDHVKNNLQSLECDIEKAENEIGYSESTTSKVANILTPLFKKQGKRQASGASQAFQTADYFY